MRRAGNTKSGSSTKAATVICHERKAITAIVRTTVMRLETIEESVSVKACCAPSTSLLSREIEGAGLGAREERKRHLLDVAEDLLADIVDQPFAHARRDVALDERQQRISERQHREEQTELHDQARVVPDDAPVDDLAIDQGVPHPYEGVDHDHAQKDPEHPPVRRGKPHDPSQRARRELLLGHGTIPRQRPHPRRTVGHAASRSHHLTDPRACRNLPTRWTGDTPCG